MRLCLKIICAIFGEASTKDCVAENLLLVLIKSCMEVYLKLAVMID